MIQSEVSAKGKQLHRLQGLKYGAGVRFFLFAALAVLLYAALTGNLVPRTYDIQPNAVSEATILAPSQVEDFVGTEKAKEEAAKRVQPVYTLVPLRNDQLVQAVYDKLEQVNGDAEMQFDTKVSLYRSVFPSLMADHVDQQLIRLGTSGQYNDTLLEEMRKRLTEQQYKLPEETYYKLPRPGKDDIAAMETVTRDIVSKLTNEPVLDAQTARARVTELVNSSMLATNTLRELAQETARFIITPNKFFDAKETEAAKAEAREKTKPVYISKGDTLVAKGELVTDETYQRLNRMNLLRDKVNYWPQLGLLLLVSLLTLAVYMFVRQSKLTIAGNNAQLLMFVVIAAVELLTMRIVSLGQNLGYPFVGYLAPVAMGAMLVTILLEMPLGIVASIIFSLTASVIYNTDPLRLFDYRYGFVALVGCFAAMFTLLRASQRTTILKAGAMTSLFSVAALLSLILLDSHYTLRELAFGLSFAVAGGILTAVLVIGFMPFFEAAFGILSPLKLVELSNPNHPLLRKLLTETPGTYHHSVMVGNLSEAAAEAIGADGLLCRVGSYYHDIGKTKRPSYFIENQNNIENPHDSIDPGLSTSIIVAHARDGVEMLLEHKMPKPIRDIAEQHHGTTLLKYFYHKAAKQHAEGAEKPVNEEDYRYPGPKAQSKETAIVGIADCVEAAVRSLRNPTIEQIDSMVRKIIKDRLDDGQFNECDLTLKELDTVGKALKETLLGIFHSRIEYPSELPQQAESKAGGQ